MEFDEPISSPDMQFFIKQTRRSWFWIALITLGSIVVSSRAIELTSDLVFGSAELITGPLPGGQAKTVSEIPWTYWLLLYAGWTFGSYLGQFFTGLATGWMGAVWIVASTHAAIFSFLFYALSYTPWMVPIIVIPFWVAFRVTNSDLLHKALFNMDKLR